MKVGVHQGSVLSPLVFAIMVDVVMENMRNGLMSEMLYADDFVLTSETMDPEGLREKFWKWKEAFDIGAEGEPREDKSGNEWGRR